MTFKKDFTKEIEKLIELAKKRIPEFKEEEATIVVTSWEDETWQVELSTGMPDGLYYLIRIASGKVRYRIVGFNHLSLKSKFPEMFITKEKGEID